MKYTIVILLIIFILGAISCNPDKDEDPQLWWRQKELSELFEYPTVSVNIDEILNNPSKYAGEKVRIVGKIITHPKNATDFIMGRSIEHISGTDLYMDPVYDLELYLALMKNTGIDNEIAESEYQELIGYLEFRQPPFLEGLGIQHVHQPVQLYITEIYTYTTDKQVKESYRQLYRDYFVSVEQDKQEIMAVLERWAAARSSCDVDELRQIYHPNSSPYKSLSYTGSVNHWITEGTVEVSFSYAKMAITGDTATVYLADVTIDSIGEYFTSQEWLNSKFSVDVHQDMVFQKDGNQWKVMEECLSRAPKGISPYAD